MKKGHTVDPHIKESWQKIYIKKFKCWKWPQKNIIYTYEYNYRRNLEFVLKFDLSGFWTRPSHLFLSINNTWKSFVFLKTFQQGFRVLEMCGHLWCSGHYEYFNNYKILWTMKLLILKLLLSHISRVQIFVLISCSKPHLVCDSPSRQETTFHNHIGQYILWFF